MTSSATQVGQAIPHTTIDQASTGVSARRAVLLDVLAVGISCLVFFALCVYHLDLPGLYPDEAFDVIPSMQMLLGHPVELQRNVGIPLFGTQLPLMSSSDYQGVTSTYLVLPFFALGGINVFSLRLMTVSVGLLGIILAFFLTRIWFGRNAARITVLLLAVSPAWIFWSRLGVYVVSEVVPVSTGALLAFTAWVRRRPFGSRNWQLYVGMFLMGLGLATKLLFLWYIVAVSLVTLVLWGRVLWDHRREFLWHIGRWVRVAFFAGVAFCLGAFPFLLYNLLTHGGTLQVMRANLGGTANGVNNTAVLRNIWTEADAFKVLLDGGYFWFQTVPDPHARVYANPLTPPIFAISALGLLALVLSGKRAGRIWASRTSILGGTALVLGLAFACLLAGANLGASTANVLIIASVLLGTAGTLLLLAEAVRSPGHAPADGWLLFGAGTLAGAVWWFGGSGRPDGPSPGHIFGLWPVDAAGILFWVAGGALMVVLGFDQKPVAYQKVVVAMLALTGLVVAQSAVTVSGLWSTHLIILLPLPQITIAAFVLMAGRRLMGAVHWPAIRARALAVAPAILLAGGIIACDLVVDYSYHRDLEITGGSSTFSDAIYGLSSYLEQNAQGKVVAMDWGFKRPIQLLTLDRINPVDAYGYTAQPTGEFYSGLRDLLTQPDNLYLFHDPQGTAYPRLDAFKSEVAAEGKTLVLEKEFNQRNGWLVYQIYRVR